MQFFLTVQLLLFIKENSAKLPFVTGFFFFNGKFPAEKCILANFSIIFILFFCLSATFFIASEDVQYPLKHEEK